MEVLNLIRLFWGWVFPYISRIHTAYIGEYLHFRYLKSLVNKLKGDFEKSSPGGGHMTWPPIYNWVADRTREKPVGINDAFSDLSLLESSNKNEWSYLTRKNCLIKGYSPEN